VHNVLPCYVDMTGTIVNNLIVSTGKLVQMLAPMVGIPCRAHSSFVVFRKFSFIFIQINF